MENLARYIDHTNLKPETEKIQIKTLCKEALDWKFCSVCVNPCYVSYAAELLKDSGVKVCTVVGFPLGASASDIKAAEAARAREDGASEVDMVLNIGRLKSKDYEYVKRDIRAVVESVPDCKVKVIIETCLLTDEEKVKACELIAEAGAHFVKTSTGFSKAGAEAGDVRLLKASVPAGIEVKASGGIRDYESARTMIDCGATRLGTSNSVVICEEESRVRVKDKA